MLTSEHRAPTPGTRQQNEEEGVSVCATLHVPGAGLCPMCEGMQTPHPCRKHANSHHRSDGARGRSAVARTVQVQPGCNRAPVPRPTLLASRPLPRAPRLAPPWLPTRAQAPATMGHPEWLHAVESLRSLVRRVPELRLSSAGAIGEGSGSTASWVCGQSQAVTSRPRTANAAHT